LEIGIIVIVIIAGSKLISLRGNNLHLFVSVGRPFNVSSRQHFTLQTGFIRR
jgi:hypothetical protein